MPVYSYECDQCKHTWEEHLKIIERYIPVNTPCPKCRLKEIRILVPSNVTFTVPEGALGNASTGYSEYYGDAENFKARAKGKPIPYPKPKKGRGY